MTNFDVFLSHNSLDKPVVRELKRVLGEAGLSCWLDVDELVPGENWQLGLEAGIRNSVSAAVCFGPAGIGPWEDEEMQTVLIRAVKEKRRVIPVLLPGAPKEPAIPVFLGNRTWVDLRSGLTGENLNRLIWGITGRKPEPGVAADNGQTVRLGALDSPPRPQCLYLPGGAVDTDSPLYVERPADREILDGVQISRALFTLRGPRQVGKTSLMLRVKDRVEAGDAPLQAAFIDFQAFPAGALASSDKVWRQIACAVAESLRLECDPVWRSGSSAIGNFTSFLEKQVFAANPAPLLLCFDEADRIFSRPFCDEFFGQVRSLFNLGASDRAWKKVRWLIGGSSDPVFFIRDITQSPWNIGRKVELQGFDAGQVRQLTEHLGLLPEPALTERLLRYLGGLPYLTHLLLYCWTREPNREAEFFDPEQAARGLFREHLNRFLKQFRQEPDLARAMRKVVTGLGCADSKLADRLQAAGLTKRGADDRIVPVCELYRVFFGKML